MKKIILGLVACFALIPALCWAGTAGDVESVALTIYNGDLALIKEIRPFTLDKGLQTLVLSEVSGRLRPETVHLSLPSGPALELLEQNYDYDLVDSNKLLEKFIGKEILLVDDYNGKKLSGKLLSTSGGMVVEIDGQILLNPPGRVVLPAGAADNLLLRPTLSWLVDSPAAANAKAEISYLSSGLSWSADYVMMLAADDKSAGLEGWVTLGNYSGTTYKDATLKLVAGDVNRVQPEMAAGMMAPNAAPMVEEKQKGFVEESFFEYHLYDLGRQTTIKNNQQKQIGLLTASGVPVKKLFLFDGLNGGDVRVMMEFKNDEASGMGMPLPAGVVRLFKADSKGSAQFIGEDRIKHTPKDEKLRLYTGNAFDVKGEAVQTEYKDLGKGFQASYKVTLKNHKDKEDVVVTVDASIWGDWSVTDSNMEYKKKDASTLEFLVPVNAGGEKELTFTYKVVWR
jgi:hypothetical protein